MDAIVSIMSSWFKTRLLIFLRKNNKDRKLEIGPGNGRISGFETLDVVSNKYVDYRIDAMSRLPFPDETFCIVYASHILEHIPWYLTESTLREWHRIVKKGGILEVWVPDGLKICKAFVDAEEDGQKRYLQDGWFKFNPDQDVCLWASGRIFTYGDGTKNLGHPNWHHAMFSFRFLKSLFEKVGFHGIRQLQTEEVRGYNHGWINMGIVGKK